MVGPVVVPEPGAAGGEEGAALAPTLEHLRAPVVRSHVGPQQRLFILTASVVDRHRVDADPDTNFHVYADPDLDPDHHDADRHVRKYNTFISYAWH
jgi:hypothetical protein